MKRLGMLKEKQVRHNSHLQFVKASLKNNVTPRGLQIRTSLQAQDTDKKLRKRWKKIIQNTQIQLMKLLKNHYEETSKSLNNEILNLEQELLSARDMTAREMLSTVNKRAHNLEKSLKRGKKRKLDKLMNDKHRRKRRFTRAPPPSPNDSSPTPRTVVNLSDTPLSQDEVNLLARGLKFAPMPPRVNRFELKKDIDAFARRLRLKELFYDSDESGTDDDPEPQQRRFKKKSNWNPPRNREPALEAYVKAVKNDVWRATRSTRRKDNLTPGEREAMTRLRARTDIVIKPANKGSATVVMSREAYMAEAYRQLTDHRYYRRLEEDPTEEFAHKVEILIEQIFEEGHVDKDTREYLRPENPRTARFYHQPKIHKQILPVPGRPIVSSCGAPTEHISEYVDYHLHPLVVQTASYLKDTTDFLRKLSTLPTLPPNCILVTLDVSSLYTNIPHDEGIAASRRA